MFGQLLSQMARAPNYEVGQACRRAFQRVPPGCKLNWLPHNTTQFFQVGSMDFNRVDFDFVTVQSSLHRGRHWIVRSVRVFSPIGAIVACL